jgi:ParB/RepB/Spo0J family partition protein
VSASDRKTIMVAISGLRPHPQQAALYTQPPDKEIEELAAIIKRDGFTVPIEVLPDNTIICGHRRTRAATLLGMPEIPAYVRDDLAAQGEYAVVHRLLEDNQTRRHHSALDRARHAVVRKRLGRKRLYPRLTDEETGELRDEIGRELNISGRHVGRLIRVVEHTPLEVQAAVDRKQLTMGEAYAVAGLEATVKEEIARRLRDEKADPHEVVRACLPARSGRHKNARDAKRALVSALGRGLSDLQGRLDKVGWITPKEEDTFRETIALIQRLLRNAQNQPGLA